MIEDKTLLDMVLTLGPADQADVRLQLRDVLDSVINGRADSESAVGDEINGPRGEPIAAWDRDGLLDKLHLLDRTGGLVVEVHRLRGKVFLTDGAWERDKLRTFPFADESQCLLDYAEAQGYPEWADFLIDPACGCGHHAIAFPILLPGACFDINHRAILFTTINKLLNGRDDLVVTYNNIADGIPLNAACNAGRRVLFLVNMPFALSYLKGVLPLSADGGHTGAEKTFEAIEAIARFQDSRASGGETRACIVCYSVGKLDADEWEVVVKAAALFGSNRVRWTILSDQRMWRINGRKEHLNPMDLALIPTKAECQLYISDDGRADARLGYWNLVDTLRNSPHHWDVLGYGILDIDLTH